MKPKRIRLYLALAGLAAIGLSAFLVVMALEENLLYFYTPSQLDERGVEAGVIFRLGGLVEDGSVETEGTKTRFVITDRQNIISVSFDGVLPDLFREGQGVVAEGNLQSDGTFMASQVLAKHDETYMPKEVSEALKNSGLWQDGAATK